MTDLLEVVDMAELVGEMDQEMCQSTLHMVEWRMPPHPAHWYAAAPCTAVIAVCENRKRQCRRNGSWQCITGCSAVHEYDQIAWTEIPR